MLDMFDGAYIKKSYIKSLLLFYLLRESFCTENKNNKIFQKLLINILIFCICLNQWMFKSSNQSAILNWKKIERNRLIKRIREEFQFSNSEGSIFKIISRRLLYNYFSTKSQQLKN